MLLPDAFHSDPTRILPNFALYMTHPDWSSKKIVMIENEM